MSDKINEPDHIMPLVQNTEPLEANTTTAGAVEGLAQDIANKLHPITGHAWSHCYHGALAAIIETTEAAAKMAERNSRPTYSMTLPPIKLSDGPGDLIATALRNNDHLKGQP